MDEHLLAENIEVQTSHTGMAFHPAWRYAVGDHLAQPEGWWKPARWPAAVYLWRANRQRRREPHAPYEESLRMNQNIAHTVPVLARANGIELTYDTFGDAQAPPLLLIMGLASQMIVWDDEFCAALAARGFRVIRFDNRDIGLSTRLESLGVPNVPQLLQAHLAGQPVSAAYTLGDIARDVVGLLDAQDRLIRLLATIPAEVKGEGLSLATLQASLRGRWRGNCHPGELGIALSKCGFKRRRRWRDEAGGFRALWYPD